MAKGDYWPTDDPKDMVPGWDPVLEQLAEDCVALRAAHEMLEYHGHALAAVLIKKELTRTQQCIGKFRALHGDRLPL